jgi:hypothetical protein
MTLMVMSVVLCSRMCVAHTNVFAQSSSQPAADPSDLELRLSPPPQMETQANPLRVRRKERLNCAAQANTQPGGVAADPERYGDLLFRVEYGDLPAEV